jgi:ABC-type glycerol-3-phosphate transport system substrate-binding protein
MFIREVHIMRWLAENYPDLDYGVANLPKGPLSISAGGAYMFVVSADSPHKDESWRYVQFLMSDEVYKRYAAIGGVIPTTKSVGELPEYRDDPRIRVFVEQELKSLEPFPRLQRAAEIVGEHLERYCYGYQTAEEFLVRAAEDVDAYLAVNATANATENVTANATAKVEVQKQP